MEKEFQKSDFVINQTNEVLTYFNGAQRYDALTFGLSMLKQLNYASKGVKVLLNGFAGNVSVECSIGITMRSVFLDLAITFNE